LAKRVFGDKLNDNRKASPRMRRQIDKSGARDRLALAVWQVSFNLNRRVGAALTTGVKSENVRP
jgi:hypothetical protein